MKLKPLTKQQERVFDFLETHLAAQGFPPTLREIGDAIGLANINAVRGHLQAIEKKGYISKEPDRARSIRVIQSPSRMSRLKRKMHEILKTDDGVFHQVVFGLAWTTHKNTPFLIGDAKNSVSEVIDKEAVERTWQILRKEIEKSHIVLIVKVWPNHSPVLVVRRFQNAGKILKHRYPDLFPFKELWGSGYAVTTSVDLLPDMVEQLLGSQMV